MLYVLEGCDGSGKSTLAEFITQLKSCEVEIIHATRETPNDMEWFSHIMDEAKTRDIIMDRAFWGQFVYQESNERHLTSEDLGALEQRLVDEGGKLIYVYSPERIILRRLNKRSETTSLPIRKIMNRYKSLCESAHCPVIWFNSHTGKAKPFVSNKKEAKS